MSITDELREWASVEVPYKYGHQLTAIADRIDAEHEAMLADVRKTVYQGLIEMPKDADGVPICVGDVMEERSGHTFEVASLMAFGGSANWLVLSDPRNFSSFREPHDIRHHHAPTVEDVLREFALKAAGRECMTIRGDLVDEYASKLQLREDA